MQKTYDWQRYWYKDENSPLIINGFLYIHEYTKDVFTLDTVLDVSCLVLLGEPGMGKSREIEKVFKNQIEDENNSKLYFNLSSYGDENRLVKDIFDSDKIKQWKEDSSNLYLFLDSLDEALLNINTLALLLADEIEKLPKERLFLRIACRTAEWSNLSVLENKLKEIWREDRCQILQISPLQQKDVEIAAQSLSLDAEKFLAEIFDKNVSALASKPITLQFLLNLFDKNKSLPSTQTELYEKGCLTLCEEKNERRKASKRIGKLTPEQRLVISARIAALMIFGNKSSIWIGGITGEENSDILISELSGYSEKRKDNSEFQLTEENIREVISETGLFTSNGSNRLKFSHQTFAEFLASWYLKYQELSDEVVIKLIGKKYLYPQLYETSAWIANQRPSVFQHLMKVAPAILLRSDILLADETSKVKLVDILLDLFDKKKIQGIDRSYYRKLNQSKLAEQLKPYITDKTKGWLVRSEALDMVEVCEVKELQEYLAEIVLNKEDNQDIRVRAAYAVSRVGDNETKTKLKPLVFGKEEDDERFRLKGVALDALWNEHLTAEELFSVLTPANNYFTGSYEVFLNSEMIAKLENKDLPIALDWLEKNICQFGELDFSERRLADAILFKAWKNLEDQNIFERFIKIVTVSISGFREIFKEIRDEGKLDEIIKDNDKRRKVWLKIYSSIDDEKYGWLEHSRFFGLRNEDINWLVQEWKNTKDESLKVKLLSRLKGFISYWGTQPDALDAICKACEENEVLKKEFEEKFAAKKLDSEEAKQEKESYERNFGWEKEREKEREEWEKAVSPSPTERTLESLEKIGNNEINAFIDVNYYLMFLPNGRSNKSEIESDLTQYPVWCEIDKRTKSRIVEAAKKYLENGNPENDKWIGTNTIHRPAFAGYRAIVLLEKFEPEFIKKLPKSVWEKWAAIIYHYPVFNGSGNDEYERHRQLIAKTYKIAPEKIVELFNQEIESKSEEVYWSFEKLKYCWDEILKNVLKEKLKNSDLSVSITRNVLSQLLQLDDAEAGKFTCQFIKFPIPEGEKEQELLMTAVELILTHGKVDCWKKIWQILESDIEFGRKIIEFGVSRFSRLGIQGLSEKQISDLYIWFSKQYPHNEDPIHYGVYTPGARDEIIRWRDSLLGTLKEKGTVEAVNEIEKIKEQLPHLEWLKFTLLDAEEKMREMTWQASEPQSLLKLLSGISLDNLMEQKEKNRDSVKISNLDDFEFNEKLVNQNPYLRELLEDYRNNPVKFAFFVGAGLSAGVFLMWKALLSKMIEYCFDLNKMNQLEKEELCEMVAKETNYLEIASLCKEKLGVTNYEEYLRREFSKRDFSIEQTLAYRQLFKIKPKTIITTNFDLIPDEIANIRSLENEFSISDTSPRYGIYANTNIGKAQNDWADDKPIIFKMHGCINAGGIVFTQEDFREIIYSNSQIRNFLNAMFTKQTVVFIGFGLSDPHMDSILSYLYENNKGKGKPHYILINDLTNLKIKFIEDKYEIRVINYASTDGHPQVLEFLELLEKVKDI
jgi:hypothetical protein